ncbi:MAG: tripartite tricarboxylate transporter substrate binding protein [Burkholderiaceae bacterium]
MRGARRSVCVIAAAALALPGAVFAQQDAYPSKPVRIVVGFPAGSSTDVATRVIAQRLGQALGQQFVVENRAGASSNIAARAVAGAQADGYTLFVGTIANTINATLQANTSVDISKELLPVAMMGSVPNILVAHPSLGVDNLAQLIAKAKADPGKITFASSGNGTSPHLSGELLAFMAGVRMLHVPYKGSSPAVVDLLAGQVLTMFGPASTVLPHIREGKLKALASTGLTRASSMPDLPTVDELGLKGFETSVWFGINAPLNTPAAVIEKLAAAVNAAQDSAEVQAQFKTQGIEVVRAGPSNYAALIRSETDKWARVIKAAGVQSQ